jgi:VCBS repeat-containing protein
VAGNVEAANSQAIKIDAFVPSIGVTASPPKIWPANGKTVQVTISGTITDSASGVDLTSGSYTTTDSYGLLEPSGTFTINANGTYSFTIQIDSTRAKKDPAGRTYVVTVQASDVAGRTTGNSASILVPLRK